MFEAGYEQFNVLKQGSVTFSKSLSRCQEVKLK
jgi:hypothetical protein